MAWLSTEGAARVDEHERKLRSFDITSQRRPGSEPHKPWNLSQESALSLQRSLLAVTVFTTEVDLGPPAEAGSSDSDDDYVHWISPGPIVPAEDILAVISAQPSAEALLRRLLQQIALVQKISRVQESEWFLNEAAAAKVRWYRQREEPLPFPAPRFSYEDWKATDMPVDWPPTLRAWRW